MVHTYIYDPCWPLKYVLRHLWQFVSTHFGLLECYFGTKHPYIAYYQAYKPLKQTNKHCDFLIFHFHDTHEPYVPFS